MSLEMKYFAPDLLVKSALTTFKSQIESKFITPIIQIHQNVPLEIYGDQYRLEHVLSNLVSNAIKFSDDNSELCISLSYETKSKHGVTIAVRDQGPGISVEDQLQLFQPFKQIRPGELQKGKVKIYAF